MTDIDQLQLLIRQFSEERDWTPFHTPKNLAMAVAGEAGELAAEMQWLTAAESSNLTEEQLESVRDEMADVAIYLLRLADVLRVDLAAAVVAKLDRNASRFPPRGARSAREGVIDP